MATPDDTDNGPESRAGADDSVAPRGGRHRPLEGLERVRRELSRVYFDHKDGKLDMDTAKGRAYLLSQIVGVLKAETTSESELAALLQQVRDKLGGKR